MMAQPVHAAGDNTIRLALTGCGNHGSGTVANAMNSAHRPVKLVAMADMVEDRMTIAHKNLSEMFNKRVDSESPRVNPVALRRTR